MSTEETNDHVFMEENPENRLYVEQITKITAIMALIDWQVRLYIKYAPP